LKLDFDFNNYNYADNIAKLASQHCHQKSVVVLNKVDKQEMYSATWKAQQGCVDYLSKVPINRGYMQVMGDLKHIFLAMDTLVKGVQDCGFCRGILLSSGSH